MQLFVIILEAIAALAGPAASLITGMTRAQQTFHQGSDTTPDQLATEALALATQASQLVSDTQTQMHIVQQALQEKHSDLTPTHAGSLAASAVQLAH